MGILMCAELYIFLGMHVNCVKYLKQMFFYVLVTNIF